MSASPARLIKRCAQWLPKEKLTFLPRGTRGVYALLDFRPRLKKYNVVYIGMAALGGGIKSRLKRHKRSSRKIWSHFSVFEVWDNISEEEIEELEGLFREIYRKDRRANRFNKQKRCKRLQIVRNDDLRAWKNEN